MPNYDRMQDQLNRWGLTNQVDELVKAGLPLTTAIWAVYKAHTGSKAYIAAQLNKAA